MEFFDNHKTLFGAALGFFVGLTILAAVMPAINNQENNAPLPNAEPLSEEELLGKKSYIANGCVACHTQQVRNVDMDKKWGSRPGISADYADMKRTDFWRNTATLMGTERTGPDLTNIGKRQPSQDWHLLHLYQPRAVAKKSIMPAHPWLFEVKKELDDDDVEVLLPNEYSKDINGKVVAKEEALNLVAYLQSLKQTPLPDGSKPMEFLYEKEEAPQDNTTASSGNNEKQLDGKLLYSNNCASCHQSNGKGLQGAFPALKGSAVVMDDDIELFVNIIMKGYNARAQYGAMPAVGTNNNLTPEKVIAIMNHERTSWGNDAKKVTTTDVEKIMNLIE